jgi:excinuclease ABC subunit A
MHFLPNVFVQCETCKGKRYNRETLEIRYKGKNIAEVLDMTGSDALIFFDAIPTIKAKLKVLNEVGLGYLHLGQSATTLSGGEAQRIKLSKELSKRSTGRTVYILDEPSTGLHFDDVNKLVTLLQALTDQGNTVIVIEHNLDIIKVADHILDLGPTGGGEGGYIVASGTPEEVAMNPASVTGRFLIPYLKRATNQPSHHIVTQSISVADTNKNAGVETAAAAAVQSAAKSKSRATASRKLKNLA